MIELFLAAAISFNTPDLTCRVRGNRHNVIRSRARIRLFKKLISPSEPNMIVDHIVPLQCGGCDVPSNMEWQTRAEAAFKDKTESNCAMYHDGSLFGGRDVPPRSNSSLRQER